MGVVVMAVMIVEDDDDIRADLTAILRIKGFDVEEAANGRDALAKLRAGARPCAIVLDLMMPVMNGWELRAAMRAEAALAAIPVIVVSGAGRIPDDENEKLAPSAVLIKPFELAELIEVVSRFCPPGAHATPTPR